MWISILASLAQIAVPIVNWFFKRKLQAEQARKLFFQFIEKHNSDVLNNVKIKNDKELLKKWEDEFFKSNNSKRGP
jgi:hypothetical protein